jgi:hypothetical protein
MATDDVKRGREEDQQVADEEADVGPPRPPPDADGDGADDMVGPTLPKAKKRKVGCVCMHS